MITRRDFISQSYSDRFDGVSFAELLRSRSASAAAVETPRLSELDFVDEGAEH